MTQEQFKINLEEVSVKLEQWRDNKQNRGSKIPDNIWQNIIELHQQYPEQANIYRLLGITKSQLKNKLREFGDEKLFDDPIELCKINKTPESKSIIKDQFSGLSTIVVEFCRADGCVMKIHTTNNNIKEVINDFLGANNVANHS